MMVQLHFYTTTLEVDFLSLRSYHSVHSSKFEKEALRELHVLKQYIQYYIHMAVISKK